MPERVKPIEIFRAGRHQAVDGRMLDFSDADVRAIAENYDPAIHEAPIVVGHPKHDAPAYGWVKSLAFAEGLLSATPSQVDPAFAELVEAGRFKRVSASFYPPGASANPTPESYHLRHVGFLGAHAPAVKGLKSAQFADSGDDVVTIEFGDFGDFGEAGAFRDGSIVRVLRNIRDFIADKFGIEAAEKTISNHTLDSIQENAAVAAARVDPTAFAESQANQETDMSKDAQADTRQSELDARADKLDERAKELDAQGLAFAEAEAKTRRGDNEKFIDGQIEKGCLAPGMKDGLLDFMDRLDHAETVSFGEAGKESALDYFTGLLAQSGKVIDFAEHSEDKGEKSLDTGDATAIAARATEFRESEKDAGRIITYAKAVRHVAEEHKK